MMNKKSLLIGFVIILVCLNWFKRALAEELPQLSDSEKAALLERLARPDNGSDNPTTYQSPTHYDSQTESLVQLPVGSAGEQDGTETRAGSRSRSELIPFEELVPFGTELFQGPRETLPPDDIAAASDYILGPGDNIIVALWGQVENEYSLTVDREGRIFVPQAGEMIVWGRTLAQFREQMQRKLETIYTSFDLSVSLGKIRAIRIYLTGEVHRPGAYTVSSLTSLFNALFLAGGPSGNGSMRGIRLMRNGAKVAEADLYRFLLEGDNSSDVRLESGDAIFVPVAGPRVAIRGEIRRPAIYELKGEQTVRQLLALAGNPTAEAYLNRVMMERVSGNDEWTVLDLNLSPQTETQNDISLTDGDRLTLFSVFEMKRNMVAAFGLVKHPGYYERDDSTRVSDLIQRAQLQPYDVHFKRANLFRRHSDWRREVIAVDLGEALMGSGESNIVLQDGDSLHVYSIRDVSWDKYVFIEGRVKHPGRYMHYDSMTVEDLVFLAGSFDRGASLYRAEIARTDSLGEVTLLEADLSEDTARQIRLQEDDRVYVRQLPYWQLHRTIRIEGEVMYPGEYVLADREETLYDVLTRAGGMTETSFPRGMIFERASIGESLARKRVPDLLEKSCPVVEDSLGKISRQVLFEFEPSSMNRIVLDVEQLLKSKGRQGDIVLQPGDRIFVPRVPSGISVLGAIGASGTIKFKEGEKAKYYLKRAGNFSAQADKDGVRLIRANGEVYSGGGTMNKRVEVGDIIVVPTKIHKDKDTFKTVSTALSAVGGVLTTILVIDRI
ncbi:MAG: SLBB domain-containing protein [Candidatus Zixiibacteriota bacterium]